MVNEPAGSRATTKRPLASVSTVRLTNGSTGVGRPVPAGAGRASPSVPAFSAADPNEVGPFTVTLTPESARPVSAAVTTPEIDAVPMGIFRTIGMGGGPEDDVTTWAVWDSRPAGARSDERL